jgi:hypothetical protein
VISLAKHAVIVYTEDGPLMPCLSCSAAVSSLLGGSSVMVVMVVAAGAEGVCVVVCWRPQGRTPRAALRLLLVEGDNGRPPTPCLLGSTACRPLAGGGAMTTQGPGPEAVGECIQVLKVKEGGRR